jgi:hypothetical protein
MYAGKSETALWGNTFVGAYAGTNCTAGNGMTFVGNAAGYNNTGGYNDAIGYQALYTNTGGLGNCAVGGYAMKYYNGTSGADHYNTAIGYNAFSDNYSLMNKCTGVGYGVSVSASGTDNENVFGYDVTGADNTFTFGTGTTDTRCTNGGTSWSNPSDARYKENVEDQTAGLSFINDLRPVTFQWKPENEMPEDHVVYNADSTDRYMNDTTNHGFLAQEVKEVIDNHPEIKDGFDMWSEDAKDGRQRIGQSALIPILTKAIQELSAEVKELKEKVNGNN